MQKFRQNSFDLSKRDICTNKGCASMRTKKNCTVKSVNPWKKNFQVWSENLQQKLTKNCHVLWKIESFLRPFRNTFTRFFAWFPSTLFTEFSAFFAKGTPVDKKWKVSLNTVCRANKFFGVVQTTAKKVRWTQLNAKKVAKQKSGAFNSKFVRSKKKSYPENESFLGPFRNTFTCCFPRVPSNNIHRKFCINFFTERTTVDTKMKDLSSAKFGKVASISRLN